MTVFAWSNRESVPLIELCSALVQRSKPHPVKGDMLRNQMRSAETVNQEKRTETASLAATLDGQIAKIN